MECVAGYSLSVFMCSFFAYMFMICAVEDKNVLYKVGDIADVYSIM